MNEPVTKYDVLLFDVSIFLVSDTPLIFKVYFYKNITGTNSCM